MNEASAPVAGSSETAATWWVVGAGPKDRERYSLLSAHLQAAGAVNALEFKDPATSEDLQALLREGGELGVRSIRFEGAWQERLPAMFDRFPSTLLTLKCADTVISDAMGAAGGRGCGDSGGAAAGRVRSRRGVFWPRNFLNEGLTRAFAGEVSNLDISGGAFVVGATAHARAAVAALVKAGFRRINLSDSDEGKAGQLLDDFSRSYFNVQFQFTRRNAITQMPGVHTVAINTLAAESDETELAELFYFNFLKAGGLWVETVLGSETAPLLQEAHTVGAQIVTAVRLASHVDRAWSEACFDKAPDRFFYAAELATRMG